MTLTEFDRVADATAPGLVAPAPGAEAVHSAFKLTHFGGVASRRGRAGLYALVALLAACGGGAADKGGGETDGTAAFAGTAAAAGTVATESPVALLEKAAAAVLEEQADALALAQPVKRALASTGAITDASAAAVAAPVAAPQMDEAVAVRFLNQATFGSTEALTAELKTAWRYGWLQKQFAVPIKATYYEMVDKRDAAATGGYGPIFEKTLWESYLTAPDQLRKRVGFALSQIFVVNVDNLGGDTRGRSKSAAAFFDILERNAFGNFRTLLEEVTLSPAMGTYLTYAGNEKAAYPGNDSTQEPLRVPDENYAREVMQLFTIGLVELNEDGSLKRDSNGKPMETYGTDDVRGLARVFTGWNYSSKTSTDWPNRPMTFNEVKHSKEAKVFLTANIAPGVNGTDSLKIALDALFNHPNVGPFIGKQLIQRLVTSNPSPAYVQRVSAKFNNNGAGVRGDMKAVIDAVLRDSEARGRTAASVDAWGKLREPVLRYTTFARAFGVTNKTDGLWPLADLSNPATALGQSPARSPSVFNFYRPGYVPPKTSIAAAGLVAPEFQITSETSIPGYVNFMNRQLGRNADLAYDFSAEQALAKTPAALVDRLNVRLTGASMGGTTRDTIVKAVTAMPSDTPAQLLDRARQAILLTVISPEYLVQK